MELQGTAREHYRAPRNASGLRGAGPSVGTGTAGDVQSGIEVVFQIISDDQGRVRQACWECLGPPAVIAAASWLSEQLTGVPVDDARGWTALTISETLELPAESVSGVLLVEDACKAALADLERHG